MFNLPHAEWLVDLLQSLDLACLNSNIPTFERFDTRSSTCVDISLCSTSLIGEFSWNRSAFLCGSDHYPIILTHLSPSPSPKPYSSWRYSRADWKAFHDSTYFPYLPAVERFPSIREAYDIFSHIITCAATAHIPRSSPSKRPATPWWTQECARANREKRKLYIQYKKTPSSSNLIIFKAAAATSRRINRRTRRQYFREYASSVTSSTSLSKVYKVVNKISRRSNQSPPITIKYGDTFHDNHFCSWPSRRYVGLQFRS